MEFSNRKNYDELRRHKFFAAANNVNRNMEGSSARSFGIDAMPAVRRPKVKTFNQGIGGERAGKGGPHIRSPEHRPTRFGADLEHV